MLDPLALPILILTRTPLPTYPTNRRRFLQPLVLVRCFPLAADAIELSLLSSLHRQHCLLSTLASQELCVYY